MLTENRDTRQRLGLDVAPLVKDATVIFCGAMIAVSASTGFAEPAADASGLVVKGRAATYVDNTDGGLRARIESGIFCWDNSVDHPLGSAHRIAYVEDDGTVGSDPGTHGVIAGLIVDIDDEGVWVDCRPAAIAAATGANPQAVAVSKPALTADLTGVDTGTDMTAAQAAAVVSDLAALKTAVDGIIDAQQTAGLMA